MYGDALTTKERIKERLGIVATTFDTLFDRLILSVTARMEVMCNRRFTQAVYTNELHDGSDAQGSRRTALIIKNAPVHTITSVQYKAGTNSSPQWTDLDEDEYDLDADDGILYVPDGLPSGKRNIRITYTGGFSGYSIGISTLWHFNETPAGAVDGSNLTFTLPENADQIIVTADGLREAAANLTFVAGTDTFTFAAGRAPTSTIAVDFLTSSEAEEGAISLPADLVEVAEAAAIRIFKRRDSEGRTSEGFQESQITWAKGVFTEEDQATLRAYRRGYNI